MGLEALLDPKLETRKNSFLFLLHLLNFLLLLVSTLCKISIMI